MILKKNGYKISSFVTMGNRRGVTLIEVLVVVIIMGVLSGLGVSKLQQAIRNSRIKDAAINVAAFLERTANDANRLNIPLCVKVVNSAPFQTMQVFKSNNGACNGNLGDKVSEFSLDSQNKFVKAEKDPTECSGLYETAIGNGVKYAPRLGLSAAATGCFYVEYGETSHYAAVIKTATKNSLTYKLSYDGGESWMEP